MAEPATKKKTSSSLLPDWSLLPEELLQVISGNLDNCFDVVHARSVCSSWRSTFAFPCSLLSPSYSLPTFNEFSLENEGLCTLKKIPLFLFRVRALDDAASASEFYLGGIVQGSRDEAEDQTELPPPIQCSVKVTIGESEATLMNMLDCQILSLSLGYRYRMFAWDPKVYRSVAFSPLNKEEFVVLLIDSRVLWVLTSSEMRWKKLKNVPDAPCWDLVTFRCRFYASFRGGSVAIDPCSLDVTRLMRRLVNGSWSPMWETVSCLLIENIWETSAARLKSFLKVVV
ncbi:unnamed protein product [Microthlaspi erraticum]|uniref:F-box domain-containing protein n=1 Tax=Microthlaspi erraticum TaxID=1685480 RepID=A0A6D2HHX1_9BRAS|nr:unnamed protein product [Microthlaspi erraticum]CAA7033036.1 unnamed protein product [Microthlaspi erraticum]